MTETVQEGPLYPDCHVRLTGTDGNAFALIGAVRKSLRRHLHATSDLDDVAVQRELDRFVAEATASDYDGVLRTCMRWVSVE